MKKLVVFVMVVSLLTPGITFAKKIKYNVVEVKNGGNIKGNVKAAKKVDDMKIRIDQDVDFCGKSQKALKYLLSPSLEVKNVLVIIENVKEGKAVPKQDLTIDNKKCVFEPLVGIAYKGSKFVIKNSDPILHNTNLGLMLKNKRRTVYNLALPRQGQIIEKKNRVAGLINVKCDAHPFMRAYIYSSRHPYVAITDANGNYEIKDLLPGKYKVRFWHEGFDVTEKEVEVKAGAASELNVTLKR